ncbi:RNA polymerase sigma factor SigE [Parenemella sanctibonifatiensis]|uniref:RNA polymerase sigma factor SigE n=1 Tax=Parenemella sanctibonifatiensis TaxID=2016505 RepID=A0A255EDY1_9ACTN|nr:RNA polymerase sigma factor SigE [Parenemella sanctibonifatiensis]
MIFTGGNTFEGLIVGSLTAELAEGGRVRDKLTRWRGKTPQPAPSEDAEAWQPPTWQQLVEEHSARVHRLAYRLTGNQHDAEDLTQDVFVKVFNSLHTFQPGTLEGWMHRITTNLFLDQARRRQRIRFDRLPEHADDRLSGDGPRPTDGVEGLEADVEQALASLKPEFRAAVVLCDIEGLTYDEIADVLDIRVGTVRSRISRARAQLRESLAHRQPEREGQRYRGISVESGQLGR